MLKDIVSNLVLLGPRSKVLPWQQTNCYLLSTFNMDQAVLDTFPPTGYPCTLQEDEKGDDLEKIQ